MSNIITPKTDPLFYDRAHALQLEFLYNNNMFTAINPKISGENHCYLHPDQNGMLQAATGKGVQEFTDEANRLQEEMTKVIDNGVMRFDSNPDLDEEDIFDGFE